MYDNFHDHFFPEWTCIKNILCVNSLLGYKVPSLPTRKAQSAVECGAALCIGASGNSSPSFLFRSLSDSLNPDEDLFSGRDFSPGPPCFGCFFGQPLWLTDHCYSGVVSLDLLCSSFHSHRSVLPPPVCLGSQNLSMVGEMAERLLNVCVCACMHVQACSVIRSFRL